MFRALWRKKIFRFICVGATNTLIDLTILNLLVFVFGFQPVIANAISATVSMIISYFLNHHLVFQGQYPHQLKRFVKFFVITGLSILVVQSVIISVGLHLLAGDGSLISHLHNLLGIKIITKNFVNLLVVKAFAVAGGMIWNFILYHTVVFTHDGDRDADVMSGLA